MDFLKSGLVGFFNLIHGFVTAVISNPNVSYGLTIILFTAIIRVILLPLNFKQIRSQIKMQEVQPELKKLQEKYKNDPQKSQQEMMKLYKEKGINPLGGCLPLLIQLPILWALFYVFNTLEGIKGVSFMWLPDLSSKDPFYILPILSAVTTYFSSALMAPSADSAQAKQTGTMNIGMSIFMGFMSINFKSALVLYWVVNNLFQLGQTVVMKKIDQKAKAE